MKRVSPLKHQPETTEPDADSKVHVGGEPSEASKDETNLDKPGQASTSADGPDGKPKALGGGMVGGTNAQVLFGELEHYDLDMDEILDVPYIKSSQQMSTLPRVPHDKRSVTGSNLVGGTLERNRGGLKNSALTHNEPLSLGSGSSSSQTPVRASVFFNERVATINEQVCLLPEKQTKYHNSCAVTQANRDGVR